MTAKLFYPFGGGGTISQCNYLSLGAGSRCFVVSVFMHFRIFLLAVELDDSKYLGIGVRNKHFLLICLLIYTTIIS